MTTPPDLIVLEGHVMPDSDEAGTGPRGDPLAHLAPDRAISLRWTLRDILAGRTKFLPVAEADLQFLVEMGLVEMHDDEPVLADTGFAAIE